MAQDLLDLIHTQSNEINHYFSTEDTSHLKCNWNKKITVFEKQMNFNIFSQTLRR